MEKINSNWIIIVLIFFFSLQVRSQNKEIIRPGLIRAQGTLSVSSNFNSGNHFFLHGNLEGYLTKNLSLSGEVYHYLGTLSDIDQFNFNENIFFGFSWHFTKANHDFYFGLQPGVAIIELNPEKYSLSEMNTGVNPVMSMVAGYNFYVNRFFHFFVASRFVAGNHLQNSATKLNEVRLSAGLGFNLNTMK